MKTYQDEHIKQVLHSLKEILTIINDPDADDYRSFNTIELLLNDCIKTLAGGSI